MLLIIILIGIVGGTALAAFFLGDETRRAEVSEWPDQSAWLYSHSGPGRRICGRHSNAYGDSDAACSNDSRTGADGDAHASAHALPHR